jgi:hypothetical protein
MQKTLQKRECLGSRLTGSWLYWETRAKSLTSLILPKIWINHANSAIYLGYGKPSEPRRVLFCNRVECRRENKRTERFSEKSSRYRDSLKSEVRLPRDQRHFSYCSLLFVTLVTEVCLISREPNLRFERISTTLGSQVCTDPFACRQSAVTPRFATPIHCHHSVDFNFLLLNWSPSITLLIMVSIYYPKFWMLRKSLTRWTNHRK